MGTNVVLLNLDALYMHRSKQPTVNQNVDKTKKRNCFRCCLFSMCCTLAKSFLCSLAYCAVVVVRISIFVCVFNASGKQDHPQNSSL